MDLKAKKRFLENFAEKYGGIFENFIIFSKIPLFVVNILPAMPVVSLALAL